MATLAIDAGTTLIKAVVFSDSGHELAVASRPTAVSVPKPSWSEQDMNEVWTTVVEVCAEALATVNASITSIAVTGQGDGAWIIGADGKPLRPAILWNDGRSASFVKVLEDDGRLREAFDRNGSLTSLGLSNSIMMWLNTHEPETLEKAQAVLTCSSWIYFNLTGIIGQHISQASAPWIDLASGDVSPELIELYGLSAHAALVPPVLTGSHLIQNLLPHLAEAWSLPQDTPCVMAPYDIVATATGSGAVQPGDAFVILGTTICPGIIASSPHLDGVRTGLNLLGVGDGHYLRAFPTLTGANTLSWLSTVLGVSDVAAITHLAAQSPVGSRGLLWLPYVSAAGERAPFFNPQATGNLYGLTDQHTASDIARALVEALSFIVKEALEATHTEPQRLSISGGGARSDFWCQVIADVTRVPTTRNVDSQVGAKGAQIYGAVVRGEYGGFPEAVSALITPGDSFQPDPESWEHYNERYKLFLRLRETLSPLWQETYATHD